MQPISIIQETHRILKKSISYREQQNQKTAIIINRVITAKKIFSYEFTA